jgi:BCD family chlorophyll transporter-like MFS transporter
VVYHIEIYLLFATLVALGPLVASRHQRPVSGIKKFGLADFPG